MTDTLSYRVILEPEDDGSAFNVVVPALPHILSYGSTVQDALAMAREAIELELSYLRDKGLPVPASDAEDALIERITVPVPAA